MKSFSNNRNRLLPFISVAVFFICAYFFIFTPKFAQAADPTPQAGDRILFNTDSLLSNPNINTSADLSNYFAELSSKIDVTHNQNNNGTSAFRIEWPYYGGGTCQDDSANIQFYTENPAPKSVYYQWTQHMGKTVTGGGIGNLNAFQITDPACGQSNASRKEWLIGRTNANGQTVYTDPNDPSTNRIDYIWPGQGTNGAALQFTYNSSNSEASSLAWNPAQHINEDITQTIYLQAESAVGARDGVIKLWINGVLYIDVENAATGTAGFGEFHFPTVMNSPGMDMTEYIWGVKAWQPGNSQTPNYTSPSCTTPNNNSWLGCYYSDQNLSNLVFTQTDSAINFSYLNSPDSRLNIPKQFFSAKWIGNFTFGAGDYNFNLGTDDGARVYIDNNLISNHWVGQAYTQYPFTQTMTAGVHKVEVDYFNQYNTGQVQFNWVPTGSVQTPPSDTTPPAVAVTSPASNATISGTVTLTANATDNISVVGVQFKVDGNNIGSEDTSSPYSASLDTTTLSNGSHIITAVARDSSNQATAVPITVTVNNVVTPPPVDTPPVVTPPVVIPPVVVIPPSTNGGAGSNPPVVTSPVVTPPATNPTLPYPSGSLVKDGPAIYLIRGSYKIGFTNFSAFIGLGYSVKNVVSGSTASYTSEPNNYLIRTSTQTHPWGSWILYNKTVYYSSEAGMIGVPSPSILQSNGGSLTYLVPANAADIQLINSTPLPVMGSGDGRIYR